MITRARLALVGSGRLRAVLIIAVTALVGGLGLVAVSMLRLGTASYGTSAMVPGGAYQRYTTFADGPYQAPLFAPLADAGTRPGVIFAVALIVVPILLVLDQAVRLGTSGRRRRYAALAIAGATRRDLRRWGAIEVGIPVLLGAMLAWPVYAVLRFLLGTRLVETGHGALVPTFVGPGWWGLLVLVALVGYGWWVGRRSGARLAEPITEARGERRPPRPWGLVPLALLALLIAGPFTTGSSGLGIFGTLALLILGLAGLVPWTASVVARGVGRRTGRPATLLACQRLVADARPAGRAAAAVGAVTFTGGAIGVFVGDVLATQLGDRATYLVPAALVAVLTAGSALIIALTLGLHGVETLLERRREWTALVAAGTPPTVVLASLRRESLVATLPVSAMGGVLGVVGPGYLFTSTGDGWWILLPGLLGALLSIGVVVLAIEVASLLLRRPVLAALDVEHLRTA
ncbi:hypothetical protein GCM10022215_22840 [Nocardioides fonticola]|uniref:FtsX-like permease family protein n=1 Tax=Nocardioides fonticola TaxID=450363 RepID=A0ABP7XK04_9ACTN